MVCEIRSAENKTLAAAQRIGHPLLSGGKQFYEAAGCFRFSAGSVSAAAVSDRVCLYLEYSHDVYRAKDSEKGEAGRCDRP